MLYNYKASTPGGLLQEGSIDAPNIDFAIATIQRRGLIIIYVNPVKSKINIDVTQFFEHVKLKDVVILSRQMATLFEAKVAVLNIFRLLSTETENRLLRRKLIEITDDIQSGISISTAMTKHPEVFSKFYVSLVKAGEETGKLSETFVYLADHLERSYEIVSKARNALLYPAFILVSFTGIMVLMLVVVIPKISIILVESGQQLPFATKFVIGLSGFLLKYGIFALILIALLVVAGVRYSRTRYGKYAVARLVLGIPYVGGLMRKLYISRIADNMESMLTSGISMLRSIEITSEVVGSEVYKNILEEAGERVKAGAALSDALEKYQDIPPILVQMTRIGEETGKLGYVLKTISRFYQREVDGAVDNLVTLIEPAMIVFLGFGVALLLAAVLGPIYNITGSF